MDEGGYVTGALHVGAYTSLRHAPAEVRSLSRKRLAEAILKGLRAAGVHEQYLSQALPSACSLFT